MAGQEAFQKTKALTNDDLEAVHDLYEEWLNEWEFLRAAYKGARALVAYGALIRHERESNDNYEKRCDEAIGFGYTKSIAELFNYYLFKEPVKRNLVGLETDKLWMMFEKDCNLDGKNFDTFLINMGLDSSIEGVVGILVDKPSVNLNNRAEEINNKVYPYLAAYRPSNILDFEYERDEFNRPFLSYLKVFDDESNRYHLWFPDHWEIWELQEEEDGIVIDKTKGKPGATAAIARGELEAKFIKGGVNPLNEIPFIWLYNVESEERGIGESDITEIARIDASIMKNLSQIDEIVDYAAFPMMRKPKAEKGEGQVNDDVGPTAILTFDPENPESKPDWLDARVQEPVAAVMSVIAKKIEEAYRSSNVGGMSSMEISTAPKSGAALQAEFQLLNSKLVGKGNRLVEFELGIIRFWTLWQLMEMNEELLIERSKSYDVENLSKDLENALTATMIIKSETFDKTLQKKLVRSMMPAEPDEILNIIDKEIDEYVAPDPFAFYDEEGGGEFGDDDEEKDESGKPIPGKEKPVPGKPVPAKKPVPKDTDRK